MPRRAPAVPFVFVLGTFALLTGLDACSTSGATVAPIGQNSGTPAPTQVPSFTPVGNPTPTPAPTATATPGATATPTATPTATAQPQVIHIGFAHTQTTDATYGNVAFYSPNASGPAAVVHVVANSQVVFHNDESATSHTASGLGSTGFPASFDNVSGATASGSTIDSGMTWSTGKLNGGQTSGAFTVPAGTYYFGCFYHYNSSSMRDVITSS